MHAHTQRQQDRQGGSSGKKSHAVDIKHIAQPWFECLTNSTYLLNLPTLYMHVSANQRPYPSHLHPLFSPLQALFSRASASQLSEQPNFLQTEALLCELSKHA